MNVRRWMAEHYQGNSPVARRVTRRVPRTVAWLRAARRTFPVFVAIVVASALAGFEVSPVVLAVTWPTLTVVRLAVTDDTPVAEAKTNAEPPTEYRTESLTRRTGRCARSSRPSR